MATSLNPLAALRALILSKSAITALIGTGAAARCWIEDIPDYLASGAAAAKGWRQPQDVTQSIMIRHAEPGEVDRDIEAWTGNVEIACFGPSHKSAYDLAMTVFEAIHDSAKYDVTIGGDANRIQRCEADGMPEPELMDGTNWHFVTMQYELMVTLAP